MLRPCSRGPCRSSFRRLSSGSARGACGSAETRARAVRGGASRPGPRSAASVAANSVTLRGVFITFLSDFGLKDDFVGTCHGVMKRIAPEAQIIDITHGIPATAILQGALVLANTIGFMPVGVHLAIVDPGVGGPRRPLALRDAEGRVYVGPDNGLLLPAGSRAGIEDVYELANPAYALESISRTFHGRDLFAPAAAHLATGVPLAELGPPVDPEGLVRLDIPAPAIDGRGIRATLLYVDSFGNIALNLDRDDVEALGIVSGTRVELDLSSGERYYAVMARTFADARPGDVILYEDSYKNMSLAITRGSAARMLRASPGQEIRIALAD
jgi:S-adenosyl-L-methionine hydrolase (adenosine-forming)